jgi:hypothetical protein
MANLWTGIFTAPTTARLLFKGEKSSKIFKNVWGKRPLVGNSVTSVFWKTTEMFPNSFFENK